MKGGIAATGQSWRYYVVSSYPLSKSAINSPQSLEVIPKCLDLYGDSRSTRVAFTASALT